MKKSDSKSKSIWLILWLILISMLLPLALSYDMWTGGLFGTPAYGTNYYSSESSYQIDNITYSTYCKMAMVTNAVDGFFVNSDIILTVSEGYIEYRGDSIPKNDSILVKLYFEPHAWDDEGYFRYSGPIETVFDGKNKFNFEPFSMSIKYLVSEPKHLRPVILVNGEISDTNLDREVFIEIEPAYAKTQLNLAKVVALLTIWIIYFSAVTLAFEILKWYKRRDSSNYNRNNCDCKIGSYGKFGWGLITLGVFCICMAIIFGVIPENSTNSFGFGSFGVGFISIGVAFHSINMAKDSDKKMRDIANVIFLEAVDDLEKERKEFINISSHLPANKLDIPIETYIWRSRTCIIRATHLDKDYIQSNYQLMLSGYFATSLEVLFSIRGWNDLANNVQGNIIDMYLKIYPYERNDNIDQRISQILLLIGMQQNESEQEFYNRMYRLRNP